MSRKMTDRTRQLRILSQSVLLEEAHTPYLVRSTMLIICVALMAFIFWAAITKIKERARTVGEIVPLSYIQDVQHLDGGIIEAILVRDDDVVKKGQLLIRLRGDELRSDLERIHTKLVILSLRKARLQAFLTGERAALVQLQRKYPEISHSQEKILASMIASMEQEKKVLKEQLTQKEEEERLLERRLKTAKKGLKIAETAFATQKKLFGERLVSESSFLSAQRQLNEQQGQVASLEIQINQAKETIAEYQWRLASVTTSAREKALQQLGSLEEEVAETEKMRAKLNLRIQRLEIRAPTDGVVKGLEVHTIGGVVAPGRKLMEIVPAKSELIAEVKISPNDIGHIKVGYPVTIKITSYDYSRYGGIDGTVAGLSATTFTSRQGQTYYKGMITLKKNYLGNNPGKNVILPGMIVNADIATGDKSLLAYFLKPIHKALNSAFTER